VRSGRPGVLPPQITLRCKPLHPPGLLKSFVSGFVSGLFDFPDTTGDVPVGWRFTGVTQDGVVIVLDVTRVEWATVYKLAFDGRED
jgi:hypothetical protein